MSRVDDDIEQLVEAGLLTERQAEAFILRDVELVPREATAESMGISTSTLDTTLGRARSKVEAAEATLEAVESIRHETLPEVCGNCGDRLGGSWTVIDEDPHCLECAGIDPEEAEI